jgi:ATP-dependent helicase Lhr and Lhr-like helicase
MLVGPRIEHESLFADLKAVIADEIHAFATDDRGWHMLAVLERLRRFAGRELQCIGLSATTGNPEALLDWLAAHADGRRVVVRGKGRFDNTADVGVDFVGNDVGAFTRGIAARPPIPRRGCPVPGSPAATMRRLTTA